MADTFLTDGDIVRFACCEDKGHEPMTGIIVLSMLPQPILHLVLEQRMIPVQVIGWKSDWCKREPSHRIVGDFIPLEELELYCRPGWC